VTLLRNADASMYKATRMASNRFQFFSDADAETEPVTAAD
jgi:hypothetical protein